ncbi:uncharacterized protein [Anabrus simplex]|uniref:uncharacterized protein n=1 Tax=Anabrus simplex TaxID=316456 RepID=UPI0035A3ABD8
MGHNLWNKFLWRKLRERASEGYEGVLQREESSDPLAVKSLTASGNLLTDELKTSESQFSVTPAEELEGMTSQSPLLSYGASSGSIQNHTSKSANGSIITMTLKNNHLIVETEERGVRLEDSTAKTTTKFSSSSSPHQNSVFVVEVQHGSGTDPSASHYRSGTSSSLYPKLSSNVSSQEDIDEVDEDNDINGRRSSSQKAQVHQPPDIEVDEEDGSGDDDLGEVDDEDDTDDVGHSGKVIGQKKFGSTNTGLSQSDLSMSSAGSNNPSYRYGNQLGYESGHFGYPQYVGYTTSDDQATYSVTRLSTPLNQAPPFVIKKDGPLTINNINAKMRNSIDIMPDGPLLSDVQLQDAEDDVHQEEQRKLGNGTTGISANLVQHGGKTAAVTVNGEAKGVSALQRTGSLPVRVNKDINVKNSSEPSDSNNAKTAPEEKHEGMHLNTVAEVPNEKKDGTVGSNVSAAKKRGSLPIITPDLYKQTKNLLLDKTSIQRPSLSPKFERLRNEVSPLEEVEKCPQNDENGDGETDISCSEITNIKTEYENEAFVASDQPTS